MKLLISLVFISLNLQAQNHFSDQKLYYFISKDSLLGVKNYQGKIIIPAISYNFSDRKNGQLITDKLIYLLPFKKANSEPHSWGIVYDRTGKELFAPFFFDNGPDDLNEGMMRFVENKKVGFVDRIGKKVIEAKYDFVSSFDYGIASFCNGCEWVYEDEHAYVRGGVWGYINKNGEELPVTKQRKSLNDQVVDSTSFLPYQFSYNSFERRILDSFNRLSIISKIHFINYFSPLDSNERILHYEIVEKPSDFYPWYHIKGFEFANGEGYKSDPFGSDFFVTRDGKKYLAEDYYKKIPLKTWIKINEAEAKKYLKNNPGALYKF